MSEHTPIDDPELAALEQTLAAAAPGLARRRRDEMLYACGRAAGEAAMRKRLRGMSAATAALACVSAGLAFLLLARADFHNAQIGAPALVSGDRGAAGLEDVRRVGDEEHAENWRPQMRAGWRLDEVARLESRRADLTAGPAVGDLAGTPPRPILTALTRSLPDAPWN